jgi:hypothetical protein
MHFLTFTAFPLFALLQVSLAGPIAEAADVKDILEARQVECYAYAGVSQPLRSRICGY